MHTLIIETENDLFIISSILEKSREKHEIKWNLSFLRTRCNYSHLLFIHTRTPTRQQCVWFNENIHQRAKRAEKHKLLVQEPNIALKWTHHCRCRSSSKHFSVLKWDVSSDRAAKTDFWLCRLMLTYAISSGGNLRFSWYNNTIIPQFFSQDVLLYRLFNYLRQICDLCY